MRYTQLTLVQSDTTLLKICFIMFSFCWNRFRETIQLNGHGGSAHWLALSPHSWGKAFLSALCTFSQCLCVGFLRVLQCIHQKHVCVYIRLILHQCQTSLDLDLLPGHRAVVAPQGWVKSRVFLRCSYYDCMWQIKLLLFWGYSLCCCWVSLFQTNLLSFSSYPLSQPCKHPMN